MQDFGAESDVVTASAVSTNEHSILNGLATETREEHVDNALPIRIDNHPISTDSGLQSADDSTSNSAENSRSESPTDVAKRVIDQMESSSSTDSLPSPTTEAADLPQQKPASATAKRDVSSLLTIGREDVLVPDPAFTVKVLAPGIDAFELQVSNSELVQEIHQQLMEREETCHRTCFSLHLNGKLLEKYTELKSVEGMCEGATLKVVEDPYTIRDVRLHIRHVRDLMKVLDMSDAYSGLNGASPSFVAAVASGVTTATKRTKHSQDNVDLTPPEYLTPGNREMPLMPLVPMFKEVVTIHCLKVLTLSAWNPPPGNRRLHGDLLYLNIVSLENKQYNVTCCPSGFYVNTSTEEVYNPRPIDRHTYHSLIDLLANLSPAFKKNFATIQKKISARHPFERLPTPYQTYSWVAPKLDHTQDTIRAADAFSLQMGYEDMVPGHVRDWNEELQTIRELPQTTLNERVFRERALFKVNSDFVTAATRGAVAAVDGALHSMNPCDPKSNVFLWNNIFFSYGNDVRENYEEFGGEAAAYVAPRMDLNGVKAYIALNPEGIYTVATAVVDYRGFRVTGQSVIPGIFERSQDNLISYGSIEVGKNVIKSSEKYLELLQKPARQLKIVPHDVISDTGETVKVNSSVESKGIIGNDGRHYLLDLFRTFPPDVNFIAEADVNAACKTLGYPRAHRHQLACLRQELIETFANFRYVRFIQVAAYHLLKMQSTSKPDAQPTDAGQITDAPSSPEAGTSGNQPAPAKEDDSSHDATAAEEQRAGIGALPEDVARLAVDSPGSGEEPVSDSDESIGVGGEASNLPGAAEKDEGVSSDAKLPNDGEAGQESVAPAADPESSPLASPLATAGSGSSQALREESEERVLPAASELPEEKEARRILESYSSSSNSNSDTVVSESGEAGGDVTDEIMHKAAQAAGSLSDKEFDVRFNPDCYSSIVKHASETELQKHRRLVRDAAEFLLVTQIPDFIHECITLEVTPLDGCSLIDAMHKRGINIRYLGRLVDVIKESTLDYLKSICLNELLCRCAKHLFWPFIQAIDLTQLSVYVAHFLNCFFGACPNPPFGPGDGLSSATLAAAAKRKSKKKKKASRSSSIDSLESSAQLTPSLLWTQLCKEADEYFGFGIQCDNIVSFLKSHDVQRLAILRRFCVMTGIQIRLHEYDFDNRAKPPFVEEDVLNMFPLPHHVEPKAADAYEFYMTAKNKIDEGLLRSGYATVSDAYNLFNNTFGPLHSDIAQCLRLFARMCYILGDPVGALDNQTKATIVSERCNGLDHANTIVEYTNLAVYNFANGLVPQSLNLLYRSKYLLLVTHGERHPYMSTIDSNIGLILHFVGEYASCLRFLENALQLNLAYLGKQTRQVALLYHLIARTYACMTDFRSSLNYEKETFLIYKTMYGQEHERCRESAEYLKKLTQAAVALQKRMNDLSRSSACSQFFTPPIEAFTSANVLDILNVINGLRFVQIGGKEDFQTYRVELKEGSDLAALLGDSTKLVILSNNNKTEDQMLEVD